MKVLLTGSEGFIGKPTTEALINKNHGVVKLDSHLDHDITTVSVIPKVDGVIHLAAISSTPWANESAKKAFEVNIYGTYNLLLLAKECKKFVYASSSRILYPTLSNSYIVSKILQNDIAELFKDKVTTVGLLYTSVYGKGGENRFKSINILNQIIDAAMTGDEVVIYGDGEQKRDFIFNEDVALANVKALDCERSALFNIGSGQSISLNDAIKIVEYISGKKVKKSYTGKYSEDYMMKQVVNVSSAEMAFGFRAPTSLKVGIEKCLEEYKW